jgi:nucleotide-binding universal stress UspA family protein
MSANSGPLILLPVDGSDTSARAAEYSAWFARATGGRVLVLNVQPAFEDWQTHGIGHEAAVQHRADLAREKSARALEILAGTPHEFLLAEGEPAETIGRIAEDRGCAQVVMGTRGLGKVTGVLMGSVAMKTFHIVKVPVTFVR